MGLFGTVVGMIEIFGTIAHWNKSDGIGTWYFCCALQHRFWYLYCDSEPNFWRHFRALVDGFVVEMEQQAVRLVEYMHGDRK